MTKRQQYMKKYMKEWRQRNQEKIILYEKEYNLKNKKKIAARKKKYHDDWRKNNSDHTHNAHLFRKYGLTLEEFDKIFESQGGVCKICGQIDKDRRLSVDHCHKTDEIRGLLCRNCNSGIGLLDDDPHLLRKAADYKESFKDEEASEVSQP